MRAYALLLTVAVIAAPDARSLAGEVVGPAKVKDGDSLVVDGQQIRLQGIDAPEWKQTCRNLTDGHEWNCGQASAANLRRLVGKKTVTCTVEDIDKYGRSVSMCRAGSIDLNRRQVADGWAYAFRRYTEVFVPEEVGAQAAKRGMWDSKVVPPWEWRAADRGR